MKGTFEVSANLPMNLRQGELFATPAVYPAACRYSTEPGDPGLTISAPRGFSLKLFNVTCDYHELGKDIPTQDIEINNTSAIELATARVTREIFDIRLRIGNDMDAMNKQLQAREDTKLQKAPFKVRNSHPASFRRNSQPAYMHRFGTTS